MLAGCSVCGSEPDFGARFNAAVGVEATYVNFCGEHARNFQALPPTKGWSGQFGGTHAHHTLSVYEPFSSNELEALRGSDEPECMA